MLSAIKKLQPDMTRYVQKMRLELGSVKSSKIAIKKTIPSMVRRLDMDEVYEGEKQHKEEVPHVDLEKDDTIKDGSVEKEHRRRSTDEEKDEHEKSHRKSSHCNSRSHKHMPDDLKKELQEMRDMIARILCVPKPLEKATPTSYDDFPFADDIALVDIPT